MIRMVMVGLDLNGGHVPRCCCRSVILHAVSHTKSSAPIGGLAAADAEAAEAEAEAAAEAAGVDVDETTSAATEHLTPRSL